MLPPRAVIPGTTNADNQGKQRNMHAHVLIRRDERFHTRAALLCTYGPGQGPTTMVEPRVDLQ